MKSKSELRKQAERFIHEHPDKTTDLSINEIKDLIHELNVYQVELELQNEEMQIRQAELTMLRDKYTGFFEFSPAGFLVMNSEMKVVEVNTSLCVMFGLSKSDFLDLSFTLHLDKESQDLFYLGFREVLKTKEHTGVDVYALNRYKEKIFLRLECRYNENDKNVWVNITDKTHLAELETSMLFQSKILNSIGEAVIATNPAGVITYWGDGAVGLYLWKSVEVLGKNVLDVLVPLSSSGQAENIMRQLRAGKAWAGELVVIDKNNRGFPVSITGTPLFDESGSLKGIISVSHDLTNIKEYEQTILNISSQHKAILDSISDGFFTLSPDTTVIVYNKAAEELLGRKKSETIGKKLFDAFPEAKGSIFEARYMKALDEQKPDSFDAYFDGQPFSNWYEVRIYPYNGGITVFFQVVTQKKIAEQLLQKNAEELEAQNEEMQVQNEELQRANEELQKMSISLRESEKLFKSLFEQSATGSCVVSPDGFFIKVNGRFCEMIGYTRKELLKMNFRDFTHPDDLHLDEKHIALIVKGEADGFELEKRYIHKNGSIVWIRLYSNVVREQSGAVSYAIAVIADITSRKEAENKLEEVLKHEQFLADIIRNSSQAIGIGYRDGSLRILNQAGFDLIGYRQDELNERKWNKMLTPPEYWDLEKKVLQGMIRNQKPSRYEKEYIRKDGKRIFVELNVTPQFDEEENLKFFFAFVNNITGRKNAENKIIESERKFRELFENLRDGWVSTNLDGRIIECNLTFSKMLGYSVKELKEIKYQQFTPEKWFDFEKDIVENKIFKNGFSGIYEKEYIRKDGQVFPVELSSYLIRDKEGKPTGMWGIARDITERKEANDKLQREKERAQGYLDVAGVIIIVLDTHQNVILINKKGCEVFEYDESEIIGKNYFDHFLPARRIGEVKDVFDKVVAGDLKQVEYFENEVLTKTGKEKLIAWYNTVYYDDEGKIIGLLSSGEDITERVRIQEELRESEEKYRRLFEESSDPILIIENFAFVDCNKVTPGFLGYDSIQQITGKSPWELSPLFQPDGKLSEEKARMIIDNTRKTGYSRFEWLHLKSNLEEVWVDVSLTFISEKGKEKFYTIWRDITKNKQAELVIRESEAKFRSIFNHSQIGVILINNKGFPYLINQAFLNILGYTEQELKTMKLSRFTHPDDIERSAAWFEQLVNGVTDAFDTEIRYITKDKKEIWGYTTITAVKDNNENMVYAVGMIEDISERKEAERRLMENQKQLQGLFDHMSNGFAYHEIVTDSSGKPVDYIFLEINRACDELTGISKNDAIGRKVTEVIPGIENDPADWIGRYGKVALSGMSVAFQSYSEGINRWFSISAYSPMKGYFATTFEDVTLRKKTEYELARYREQLEELVDERTKELTEKNQKLEEFNQLFVGREFRIKELRDKVQDLKKRLGKYENLEEDDF